MQTKTLLALFCTIFTIFIGVNDGAPTTKASTTKASTTSKTVTKVTDAPVLIASTPVKPLAGSRTAWNAKVDAKSKKLFNDYKKVVLKKLRATHKVAPTFKPKPTKVATQIVAGILYHYLVQLPSKKYAYVTILDRSWKKDQYGNEEHVTVRPDLYALNDKNI